MTYKVAEHRAGPSYVLNGDAVATLDPASSHKVLKAPVNGIEAGHLSEAVGTNRPSHA